VCGADQVGTPSPETSEWSTKKKGGFSTGLTGQTAAVFFEKNISVRNVHSQQKEKKKEPEVMALPPIVWKNPASFAGGGSLKKTIIAERTPIYSPKVEGIAWKKSVRRGEGT